MVQAAETLGHYAEWLDVRASQLRQLNRMSFATPVVIGRKVKLDFSKVTPISSKRGARSITAQLQEAFFTQFRIKGNATHVIALRRVDLGARAAALQHSDLAAAAVQPRSRSGRDPPGHELVIPIVEPTAPAEPAAA